MEIVRVNLMYRDASNYKEFGETYFKNRESLTLEEIEEAFEPIMNEPIMVQYYGIKSIAPVKSEFELVSGDDHAFCEITDIVFEEGSATNLKDIREVIELIEKGGDSECREGALKKAITNTNDHMIGLIEKLWEL